MRKLVVAPVLTRRHALGALAAGASVLPSTLQAQGTNVRPPLLPAANVCMLTPRAVEGPFYFDPRLERGDITEGKPGVPLGLELQVIEGGNCMPVKDARVDIWHADALGCYSGYAGQSDTRDVSTVGERFLRGTQFSDQTGRVKFATIYPGWYQGRTTHIHCKVFLDNETVLTTQLYFPDALSEYIYGKVKPYSTRRRQRDTVNATDGVLKSSDEGHASFVAIKEEPGRYLAALVIGVDRTARHTDGFAPNGPPPEGFAPPSAAPRGLLVPGIVKEE